MRHQRVPLTLAQVQALVALRERVQDAVDREMGVPSAQPPGTPALPS